MGKNFRNTKQRHAIRLALAESSEPLTPQAIQRAALAHTDSLGIATVYRYLRRMVEDGEVEQLELPGLNTCYMIPRQKTEPFLICERSQRVKRLLNVDLDLPTDSLPEGFKVNRFEVLVYGEFADSERSEAPAASPRSPRKRAGTGAPQARKD